MLSNRYTIDARGRKAYVGTKVYYKNKLWLLEDIEYLSWSVDQFLTLQDINNKNKRVTFVSPSNVIAKKR
jgi:hypothetical protein